MSVCASKTCYSHPSKVMNCKFRDLDMKTGVEDQTLNIYFVVDVFTSCICVCLEYFIFRRD